MRSLQKLNEEGWQRRQEGIEHRYKLKNRFKLAHRRLIMHQPRTWLDVGTGNGYLASVTRQQLKDACIIGVDFAKNALSIARSLDGRLQVDLDKSYLPFADKSFDYVTCLEVLEHVVFLDHMLEELYRVTKPGGHCLISVPNLQFIEYLFSLIRGKIPHPAADPRHMSVFTLRFLDELMSRVGYYVTYKDGCDVSPEWLSHFSVRYLSKTIMMEGEKR